VTAEYVASLIEMARELGLDRIGFTDASVLERARVALHDRNDRGLSDTMGFTFRNPERSTDPTRAVDAARSVIVAARSYNVPDHEEDRAPGEASSRLVATVARYARIDQYTPLRKALQLMALRLRADGHRAVVFADENDVVDREVAYRAGLGWFGKNANLLLPGAGSFFSLGSIVTTAILPPAPQPAPDGCGTCRVCIDACPTAAIVDEGVIDARRCLAWLVQKPGVFPVEFREALGDRVFGCDDCQLCCPWNKFSTPTQEADFTPRHALDRAQLLTLFAWSEAEFLQHTEGSPIRRIGHECWLRNLAVALGNAPPDQAIIAALTRRLDHPSPLVREHVAWALQRQQDAGASLVPA